MRVLHNFNRIKKSQHAEAGQSLIETIVAMSILVTALVSCLGLTLYALAVSQNSQNELVAVNLAREGVEVVRMMRDSNWLGAGEIGGATDFNPACTFPANSTHSLSTTNPCYPEAFQDPVDIQSSGNSNDYRILFNPAVTSDWRSPDRRSAGETYFLCLQPDGTYRHDRVGETIVCTDPASSQFARRVQITTGLDRYPYTPSASNPVATGGLGNSSTAFGGHSPEKVVTSTVVWRGKGCAEFTANLDPVAFPTRCKITLTERLSNWKDYQ